MCVYIYMCVCIYIYMCVYIYMCMCIYIYICICIYTYIKFFTKMIKMFVTSDMLTGFLLCICLRTRTYTQCKLEKNPKSYLVSY